MEVCRANGLVGRLKLAGSCPAKGSEAASDKSIFAAGGCWATAELGGMSDRGAEPVIGC